MLGFRAGRDFGFISKLLGEVLEIDAVAASVSFWSAVSGDLGIRRIESEVLPSTHQILVLLIMEIMRPHIGVAEIQYS